MLAFENFVEIRARVVSNTIYHLTRQLKKHKSTYSEGNNTLTNK